MEDKKKKAMKALLEAVKDNAEKATKADCAAEAMHHTQAAVNASNAFACLESTNR